MLMHGEINVLFGAYRRSDYGQCAVYTYLALLFNKCTCIHCDPRDLDYTLDMGPFSNTGDTYFSWKPPLYVQGRIGLLGSSGPERGGEGPYIEQNLKDSTALSVSLVFSCRHHVAANNQRRRKEEEDESESESESE